MSDITDGLDLLGDWLDAKGYTEEAGLCTRAMDEINRLREALNRIDGLATTICMKNDAGYPIQLGNVMQIYQAARAAMGETDG